MVCNTLSNLLHSFEELKNFNYRLWKFYNLELSLFDCKHILQVTVWHLWALFFEQLYLCFFIILLWLYLIDMLITWAPWNGDAVRFMCRSPYVCKWHHITLGIIKRLLFPMSAFLNNKMQHVAIEWEVSGQIPVVNGVPQSMFCPGVSTFSCLR